MFRPLRGLLVAACLAAVAFAVHVKEFVTAACAVSAAALKGWVIEPALDLAAQPNAIAPPAARVYQMREYRDRQIRRETPRIESTWRMCPSA